MIDELPACQDASPRMKKMEKHPQLQTCFGPTSLSSIQERGQRMRHACKWSEVKHTLLMRSTMIPKVFNNAPGSCRESTCEANAGRLTSHDGTGRLFVLAPSRLAHHGPSLNSRITGNPLPQY